MIELSYEQAPALEPLFTSLGDTIIQSFLQGHMGRGWADKDTNPTCGLIGLGDFYFLAGDFSGETAAEMITSLRTYSLAIADDPAWGDRILALRPGSRTIKRYAIKKEPDVFDRERLEGFIRSMPDGYSLRRIDGELYDRCVCLPFARDFVGNFASREDFVVRGLGFCVMCDGEIAGGASSYNVFDEGIEIEIVVDEAHRRKGLATAVGAKLILACLDRGLYPNWDAANLESVALCEKLGYHFDHEYDTYAVK